MNDKFSYIAIAGGAWGKGATIQAAHNRLREELPRRHKHTPARTFKVHPETVVNGMGDWEYPQGAPAPEEVEGVRKPR